MKLFILTALSIIIMSCVTVIADPEIKESEVKRYVVIGVLIDTPESRQFYDQYKAMIIYPFDDINPIDITAGLQWLARNGKICEVYGHNPDVGECGVCGRIEL